MSDGMGSRKWFILAGLRGGMPAEYHYIERRDPGDGTVGFYVARCGAKAIGKFLNLGHSAKMREQLRCAECVKKGSKR